MARLTNATSAITGFLFSVVLMTSCSTAKDEKTVSAEETAQTVAETKVDDNAITPSFDCAKAKTEVEKLICSDPELARLDREMADKYNAMYQQMRKENPVDLDRYNQEYPKLLVRRQKGWIERRNKLKNIDSLKKAYNEQIGIIESYEYLKGCYRGMSDATTLKKEHLSNTYASSFDLYFCDRISSYYTGHSVLLSLYESKKRNESLQKIIKEKDSLRNEVRELFSREELKAMDELFRKNPDQARKMFYKKTDIKFKNFYRNKEEIKSEVDSLFSNACDFYVSLNHGYGGLLGAGVHSIRYKEPDGEYTLNYVGLVHSCAFYTYEKAGRGLNAPSVSVKTPAMKGSCYPHEPLIVYKGNDYIKLSARDVTDNLHRAKYALYRFDQKSVSFIYDCSIKE